MFRTFQKHAALIEHLETARGLSDALHEVAVRFMVEQALEQLSYWRTD